MNPKTLLVALGSAALAAGLTFWAVGPLRTGPQAAGVPRARIASPTGPPLVISTAGPESKSEPDLQKIASPVPTAARSGKPSALGEPIAKPQPVEAPTITPPVERAESVVQPSATPTEAPVQAPVTVVQDPAAQTKPAPPTRVTLNPPKEIDRPQPAVLRETEIRSANTATIPPGTLVNIRIGETLTSQKNLTGDNFFGTLDQPLVADGFVLAEKGARVEGKVIEVEKAGHMTGTARISLELTQINTSDGQRLHIQTSTFTKDGAERSKQGTAAKIGGGAVLGAIIGAAAGGGKGAAVGAGAGGAVGTGAVLLSGGRTITIPVETRISFRIDKPVTVTERVVQ